MLIYWGPLSSIPPISGSERMFIICLREQSHPDVKHIWKAKRLYTNMETKGLMGHMVDLNYEILSCHEAKQVRRGKNHAYQMQCINKQLKSQQLSAFGPLPKEEVGSSKNHWWSNSKIWSLHTECQAGRWWVPIFYSLCYGPAMDRNHNQRLTI